MEEEQTTVEQFEEEVSDEPLSVEDNEAEDETEEE